MYLNIVNNLSFDHNKKRKSFPYNKDTENPNEEVIKNETLCDSYEEVYHSIFYGQLTQNWLKVTN